MRMLEFEKITEVTQGKILSKHDNPFIKYLLLDSRKINSSAESLFFAIKGVRHDGHQYISQLYKSGVRSFIVEESVAINLFPEANIYQVKSSVAALQDIVAWHRSQYDIPVIGITGSNGKTIVKEWLAQLLNKDHVVIKNPKSYNSQIGVPLSVWEMDSHHTIGVFEAGISLPGEMIHLEKIVRPTIGLFTNIGPAHDEGFTSAAQKIQEKLMLFKNADVLFFRKDHGQLTEEILKTNIHALCWSDKEEADFSIKLHKQHAGNTFISLKYKKEISNFSLPFSDDASVENIIHCLCILLYLEVSSEEIQKRILELHPIAMRLELKQGIQGCYIIDDTYNNDLAGLSMALNFLDQQKQRNKKTLILSDLLETGSDGKLIYENIAKLIKEKNITRLIGIGNKIGSFKNLFDLETFFYQRTEDFLRNHSLQNFQNEIILVKGARIFEFEKIVKILQQKMHGTVLEVNLDALSHNLNFYRSKLKPGTKIMVMVKAFAYGSGSFEVANLLQFHRVDYLAVAYADEGVSLRENGITVPIMVMNPSAETFDKIRRYNLEPEIYSFKILEEYLSYSEENNNHSKIHLKLDTGMHRLGFENKDIERLGEILKNNSLISVSSIFTHLAGADEALHNNFTVKQLENFIPMAEKIESVLGYKTIKHALNSAGIVRFPSSQMDMVRLGVGLYGVEANGLEQSSLQTVGTLKTIISQIKKIEEGESIGYGRKGKAEKATTIATIAIGYADGYDRRFSNGKGKVLINGKLCPIIGNVCMDMCMVDVSDVKAEEGDEVIVFGKELPIYKIAAEIGTISYEILTSVSERVKRVFFAE